jgi:hypothetical protein
LFSRHQAMKICVSGIKFHIFLTLGPDASNINITLRILFDSFPCCKNKSLAFPLSTLLDNILRGTRHFGQQMYFWFLSEVESRFLGRPSHNPFTISSDLSWLPFEIAFGLFSKIPSLYMTHFTAELRGERNKKSLSFRPNYC